MKRFFTYATAIASMILVLASCEKDPQEDFDAPKGAMKLQVVSDNIDTKSSASSSSANRVVDDLVDLSENGVNLFLSAVEEDNLDNPFGDEPATKGTIVTTENFSTERVDDFHIWLTTGGSNTYVESGNSTYPQGAGDALGILKSDDYWYAMYTKGSEAYDNYIHWPSSALNFWCWSGASKSDLSLKVADDGKSMSFSYANTEATAANQKDLLFAYANSEEPSTKGNVGIHFYHALAAVQFCVGGLDDGVKITNIKLTGVKNSADGVYSPSGSCTNAGTDISKDAKEGNKDTFSGDVTTLFGWTITGSETTDYTTGAISDENNSAIKDATGTQTNKYTEFGTTEGACTFFLIPQALGDNIKIELTAECNGTYTLAKSVTLGTAKISEWKAGKIYRYTISGCGGDVDVDVEETLDGVDVIGGKKESITTKEDVYGLNDGNVKTYIRAAVVGNWYNDANRIVAPFSSSSIVSSAALPEGWFAAQDASKAATNILFYYYEDAVEPGAKTSTALIEEYTKSNAEAPIDGAHLEINIIMQAIDARGGTTDAASAWGVTYPGNNN